MNPARTGNVLSKDQTFSTTSSTNVIDAPNERSLLLEKKAPSHFHVLNIVNSSRLIVSYFDRPPYFMEVFLIFLRKHF